MPMGGGCESDKLVWPFSVYGCYSVKIGYYSIHPCYHPNHRHMRASGSHCVSKVWKLIWCSPLIPEIKNFMWRAVKGCLPTKALLFIGIWDHPLCARSVKMSRKQSSTYCYTVFGLPVSGLEACYVTELICKASPPLTSGCSVRLVSWTRQNLIGCWFISALYAGVYGEADALLFFKEKCLPKTND
ncbi:hypothetical protein GBA52_016804 [Prunus armeniaca]|nr:hypothetical protein GBA52_016804 [Prunus armeniaca]